MYLDRNINEFLYIFAEIIRAGYTETKERAMHYPEAVREIIRAGYTETKEAVEDAYAEKLGDYVNLHIKVNKYIDIYVTVWYNVYVGLS